MNILPRREKVRNFINNVSPVIQGGVAFCAGYALSGPAQWVFGKVPDYQATGTLIDKLSGAASNDPLVGIGMGLGAAAGYSDKTFPYALWGLAVTQLYHFHNIVLPGS